MHLPLLWGKPAGPRRMRPVGRAEPELDLAAPSRPADPQISDGGIKAARRVPLAGRTEPVADILPQP